MNAGIIEVDTHGLNIMQAKSRIEMQIARAEGSVYRIRVIHGFHGGTGIKQMILEEFSYGRNEKVIRIQSGINPGITELILREL